MYSKKSRSQMRDAAEYRTKVAKPNADPGEGRGGCRETIFKYGQGGDESAKVQLLYEIKTRYRARECLGDLA